MNNSLFDTPDPWMFFLGPNEQNKVLQRYLTDPVKYPLICVSGYPDLTWFVDSVIGRYTQGIIVYLGDDDRRCPHAHLRASSLSDNEIPPLEFLARSKGVTASFESIYAYLTVEVNLRREQFHYEPNLINQPLIEIFVDSDVEIPTEWTKYKIRAWYTKRIYESAMLVCLGDEARQINQEMMRRGRGFVKSREQHMNYGFIVTDDIVEYFLLNMPLPFWYGDRYLRIHEGLGLLWENRLMHSPEIKMVPKLVTVSKDRTKIVGQKEVNIPVGNVLSTPVLYSLRDEYDSCIETLNAEGYTIDNILERVVGQVCSEYLQTDLYDLRTVLWASNHPYELMSWAGEGFVRCTETGALKNNLVRQLISMKIPRGTEGHSTLVGIANHTAERMNMIRKLFGDKVNVRSSNRSKARTIR